MRPLPFAYIMTPYGERLHKPELGLHSILTSACGIRLTDYAHWRTLMQHPDSEKLLCKRCYRRELLESSSADEG